MRETLAAIVALEWLLTAVNAQVFLREMEEDAFKFTYFFLFFLFLYDLYNAQRERDKLKVEMDTKLKSLISVIKINRI